MRRLPCAAAALLLALLVTAPPAAAQDLERGRYLAAIMDCTGCHTPGALAGQPDETRFLGGADIGFMMSGMGIFYPPNLTPDVATGLGAWTEDEIVRAIRTGERPDGRILVPMMPWPSYGALTEEDAHALVTYLKSLEPVSYKAPGPFGPDESPGLPYLAPVMP